MGSFNDAVYAMVCNIPAGKVANYGQIARLIGQPRKARFVGYAMHVTPQPQEGDKEGTSIPSHRVVFKDGSLCEGYAFGGPEVQKALLEAEGVQFSDDNHVDMDICQWDGRIVTSKNMVGTVLGELDAVAPVMPPDDFDWEAELGEIQ